MSRATEIKVYLVALRVITILSVSYVKVFRGMQSKDNIKSFTPIFCK